MSPWVSLRFLQTQTDARLVALARAGHERAFEALVVRYRKPLLAYCRRLLVTDARAEDALQQALLHAWTSLRAGTEVSDLKAWLYRIAHNAAVSTLRRPGMDQVELQEGLHEVPAHASDLDTYVAMRHALACVAALPERQRQVIVRTALDGQTHEQVARALGLTNVAVRGLVYRARATLRAGATALTPPSVIQWLLSTESHSSLAQRLSELGAGGGSAGFASLLLKGGAVAISAGALVAGAAVVHTATEPGGAHARPLRSAVVRGTRTRLTIADRPAPLASRLSAAAAAAQQGPSASLPPGSQTKGLSTTSGRPSQGSRGDGGSGGTGGERKGGGDRGGNGRSGGDGRGGSTGGGGGDGQGGSPSGGDGARNGIASASSHGDGRDGGGGGSGNHGSNDGNPPNQIPSVTVPPVGGSTANTDSGSQPSPRPGDSSHARAQGD